MSVFDYLDQKMNESTEHNNRIRAAIESADVTLSVDLPFLLGVLAELVAEDAAEAEDEEAPFYQKVGEELQTYAQRMQRFFDDYRPYPRVAGQKRRERPELDLSKTSV